MKTILDDVEGFFEQGGWDFLDSEKNDVSKTQFFLYSLLFCLQKLVKSKTTIGSKLDFSTVLNLPLMLVLPSAAFQAVPFEVRESLLC